MVTIKDVEKGSRAYKAGIRSGDILTAVNGFEINDVLDYRYYTVSKKLRFSLMRDGNPFEVSVSKRDEDEEPGLTFETYLMDRQHSCKNGCVFCFIDQNPKGMRDSIYFKDDDERLSYFFGNYVTLTNLTDEEAARIVKMRISPVNISVHTTDPELRVKMMKNKNAGKCLRYLRQFYDGEIEMNCQIVLCRGLNDGENLIKTLRDLSVFAPYVRSIAVVPAGLTAHREGLYPLSDFSEEESARVIETIDSIGEENLKRYASRLCYASDEWYLRARQPIPDETYYDEYPQLENGVGMIRLMDSEIDAELERLSDEKVEPCAPRDVSVVTGEAAFGFISGAVKKITAKYPALHCRVFLAKNLFFGGGVTVAGLLTGSDLVAALQDQKSLLGRTLYIPEVMLRHEKDLFLDNMTVGELSAALGVDVVPISSDGADFVRTLLGC